MLLESFLQRCLQHPKLKKSHNLHSIIKGQYSAQLRQSSTILTPKPLKKPDAHFTAAQEYTHRFTAQLSHLAKVHSRITANIAASSLSMTQLGLHFNGWSLSEQTLSASIESTGIFQFLTSRTSY